jgi:hypothetical protein
VRVPLGAGSYQQQGAAVVMRQWKVTTFFERRDAWIGVFWDRPVSYGDQGQPLVRHLKVYVCLLPFLPVLFHRTETLTASAPKGKP